MWCFRPCKRVFWARASCNLEIPENLHQLQKVGTITQGCQESVDYMRPHLNCELNSENVQTFLRRWEVFESLYVGFSCKPFYGFGALPGQHTCHLSLSLVTALSFFFAMHAFGTHESLKNEGSKKCVTIHIYLCNVDVFVHICVIFPGWRRWQQLLVSNAVSTFPKQLTHTTQQYAASETLKINTKNMQSW